MRIEAWLTNGRRIALRTGLEFDDHPEFKDINLFEKDTRSILDSLTIMPTNTGFSVEDTINGKKIEFGDGAITDFPGRFARYHWKNKFKIVTGDIPGIMLPDGTQILRTNLQPVEGGQTVNAAPIRVKTSV